MKLTYWIAECLNDASCYSLRRKTKKEILEYFKENGDMGFGAPRKVSIEYDNAFDLMRQCMEESTGWWEADLEGLE